MHVLCYRSGIRLAMATVYGRGCREPHQDFGTEQPAAAEDGSQVECAGEAAVSEPEGQQQGLASAAEKGCLGHLGRLDRYCRGLSDS